MIRLVLIIIMTIALVTWFMYSNFSDEGNEEESLVKIEVTV